MKIFKPSNKEWLNFTDKSEESTFFHTPIWYNLWTNHSNIRIETLKFTTDTNEGVLPLYSSRKKWYRKRKYYASPQGTYGGVLGSNKMNQNEQEQLTSHLKKMGSITIHSNPYQQSQFPNFSTSSPKVTQSINLESINKNISENWSSKHKASLKKSKSFQLEIVQSDKLEEWLEYGALYQEIVKERNTLSSNNYSIDLFKSMFEIEPRYRKLILVKYENRLVCGGIFFIYQKRMFYWHGVSSKDGKSKCASFTLLEYAIKIAKENKCNIFDFLPSGGNAGVEHFKKGFGTTKINCAELVLFD